MPTGYPTIPKARVHGTSWGYKRGCRCQACADNHRRDALAFREKSPNYQKDYLKTWNLTHPDKVRQYTQKTKLWVKYGLSVVDYDAMWEKQEGLCAICHRPSPGKRRLAVDHCHVKGKIRGLLCSRCNGNLGWFENNLNAINNYMLTARFRKVS